VLEVSAHLLFIPNERIQMGGYHKLTSIDLYRKIFTDLFCIAAFGDEVNASIPEH